MTETQPGGSPTVLRMILARQLQALREKAGMTYEQAAQAIYSSEWTIRRMERAEGGLKPLTVKSLLTAYGVTDPGEIDAFLSLSRDASKPGWWHSYDDVLPPWFRVAVGLEESATLIHAYEPQVVPGLLQTEGYIRAITVASFPAATDDFTERSVALRLARQQLLRRPDPPEYWVVLDETVLRRPIGGHKVMRAQLEHLIKAAEQPNVTIQVIPFAAAGTRPYTGCSISSGSRPPSSPTSLHRGPDRRLLPGQARRISPVHRSAGPHGRPGRLPGSHRHHPAQHREGDLRCIPG